MLSLRILVALAVPLGVGLAAVEWTREWIAAHGDELLPAAAAKAGGA